ncbi:polyketide cyclase [bacterium]|jgi:hypothetical protein|nr:polyketide cyclase [bacterium]
MAITIHEVSQDTKASKETIWDIWKNVEKWPDWDKELEWVKINGEFKQGQTGKLKPKGGPVSKYQITSCVQFKEFSDSAKLPLATLVFDHWITPNNNGISITHKISIRGPLARIFKLLLGENLKKGLTVALPKLVELAEKP